MRHANVALIAVLLLLPLGGAHAQGSAAAYNAKLRTINRLSAQDWYELGLWCKERMMWLYAEQAFRKSMGLGSRYRGQACYQLAVIAQGNGKPDEAIQWIEKALKAEVEFTSD